jgi:pyruvate/2-oxoglutarate/acetoin dehydrogenase E1 component
MELDRKLMISLDTGREEGVGVVHSMDGGQLLPDLQLFGLQVLPPSTPVSAYALQHNAMREGKP